MEKTDDLKDFKTCPTCGYSFKGRKNKKFCSLDCKTIANNQIAFLRNQRVDIPTKLTPPVRSKLTPQSYLQNGVYFS
jgi:hypothetical protein